MRLFGLADKVLVVDEAHAYDAYMGVEIQELLRFQAALGGSAVVLSATLSRKQRRSIAQAWADGVAGGGRLAAFGGGVELTSSEYPLATVVAAAGVAEQPLDAAGWSKRAVAVRLVHDVDRALEHVLDASRCGGAVAWVRNTVDDCLDAAARLRERGVDALVFHARFAQGDRQAREMEVMQLFGKDAPAEARRGRVLVATQVIEQSLDLDFDAMVSDVAPIDLLVQRAGRLWRHQRRTDAGRPDGLATELVVLAPEPMDNPPSGWLGGEFKGTAYVYEDAGVLWRTVRVLAHVGRIETPEGLRALIERVYAPEEDTPASLLSAAQRAEGKQGAHAAAANYGVLKAPDGYHAGAVAWVSDVRMPTRLGESRTRVRLARARPDGGLEPWVRVAGPPWKSWALSEVSVSSYRVPSGSMPEERHADAVARLRAGWGRFEQDIPVVVLEQTAGSLWSSTVLTPGGKTRRIAYTAREGLGFPASAAVPG
jgi:CRISPR-associated endonuclease/helicase Cas3